MMVCMKFPEVDPPRSLPNDNARAAQSENSGCSTLDVNDVLLSSVEVSSAEVQPRRVLQLLPGERRGWWSLNNFDRRTRVRTVAAGAVEDVKTKILMDTGANVSMMTASFARKLKGLPYIDTTAALEFKGIGPTKACS